MATGGIDMQPGTGEFGEINPTVVVQNLLDDPLLHTLSRADMNGRSVPMIGGIPLLAKLGQGGMGAVYHGIHPRLEKEVAVKVLPFHLAEGNPKLVERFFREAKIAAKVQSQYLVNVTDVNREGGLCYLVMEFVSGTSAGTYLKRLKIGGQTGLSESVVLDIGVAAAAGLAAAHAEGVIHRDIKPDNIMIPKLKGSEDLNFKAAKLADLGLARIENDSQQLTMSASCMGTPGFLAPEQAQDAKSAGKPADVFSMGATLYALLAGHAPFKGTTTTEILMAMLQNRRQPITEIRPDLSARTASLIERCLNTDPAKRPPDGAALLQELRVIRMELGRADKANAKGTAPVPAQRKPPPASAKSMPPMAQGKVASHSKPAPKPAATPNHKPLLIVGGIVAVAVLSFAVAQLTSGRRTPDPNVTQPEKTQPVANLKTPESKPTVTVTPTPPKPSTPAVATPPIVPPKTPDVRLFPLWDGKESVADYAKRVNLPPTQTLDLGGGVKLEVVLIPPGKFIMGSPETEKDRSSRDMRHEVSVCE